MDTNGHGTHVAGIIGAAAAGPGGVTGVAPGVDLVALRIFGTDGYTWDSIIISALEMAWDMRVDVVNMSLGDSFSWPLDPSAVASKWLFDRGVVVVASAGNEGDYGEYALGSPAVGPDSIAVASFENIMATRLGFLSPSGQPMAFGVMDFSPAPPSSGQSAEIVFVGLGTSDQDFRNPDGSSKVAGKIALIARGAITFREKSMRAQAHGAVQAIIHNSGAGFFEGTLGEPGAYIPTLSIAKEDGLALRNLMEQGPVYLTWTGQTYHFANGMAGQISSFSSWGPSPDLALKPDLTAPGGAIYSTVPMPLGAYASYSGTSMAAPHVAGAAALIVAAKDAELGHGRQRSEAVRALLMNTSVPQTIGIGGTELYPVHRQGAGMIDVYKAVTAQQRVTPDKLSLGEMEYISSAQRRITVRNMSSVAQTYTFELIGEGVSLAAEPAVLALGPGRSGRVWMNLQLDASLPGGLFYGWIAMVNSSGERVAHIPYIGFKGDYQAESALDPLGEYGFPWLAALDSEGYLWPVNAMDLYPDCGCEAGYAFLVYSLARQAEQLRVEILNAQTGRSVGELYRADYVPRFGGEIDYFIFDGTTGSGRALPAGVYKLRLKVLRPLGNSWNPNHWDIWTSGPITLHR